MNTHTYTHVYICMRIHIHIHMHIYTYIHVSTHTHMHIYTHTRTKCSYARMQARLKRRRGSDCEVSPTWPQDLRPSPCPLQFRGGSSSVANSTIVRPHSTTDKRGTTATNSSSWHHHDSTTPWLQLIVCTGAQPIPPVHGPPKLQAKEATPRNEITFLPFLRVSGFATDNW